MNRGGDMHDYPLAKSEVEETWWHRWDRLWIFIGWDLNRKDR